MPGFAILRYVLGLFAKPAPAGESLRSLGADIRAPGTLAADVQAPGDISVNLRGDAKTAGNLQI